MLQQTVSTTATVKVLPMYIYEITITLTIFETREQGHRAYLWQELVVTTVYSETPVLTYLYAREAVAAAAAAAEVVVAAPLLNSS